MCRNCAARTVAVTRPAPLLVARLVGVVVFHEVAGAAQEHQLLVVEVVDRDLKTEELRLDEIAGAERFSDAREDDRDAVEAVVTTEDGVRQIDDLAHRSALIAPVGPVDEDAIGAEGDTLAVHGKAAGVWATLMQSTHRREQPVHASLRDFSAYRTKQEQCQGNSIAQ